MLLLSGASVLLDAIIDWRKVSFRIASVVSVFYPPVVIVFLRILVNGGCVYSLSGERSEIYISKKLEMSEDEARNIMFISVRYSREDF